MYGSEVEISGQSSWKFLRESAENERKCKSFQKVCEKTTLMPTKFFGQEGEGGVGWGAGGGGIRQIFAFFSIDKWFTGFWWLADALLIVLFIAIKHSSSLSFPDLVLRRLITRLKRCDLDKIGYWHFDNFFWLNLPVDQLKHLCYDRDLILK